MSFTRRSPPNRPQCKMTPFSLTRILFTESKICVFNLALVHFVFVYSEGGIIAGERHLLIVYGFAWLQLKTKRASKTPPAITKNKDLSSKITVAVCECSSFQKGPH